MPKPETFMLDDLTIDGASFASEASAVLGIRGSGKTYTATLLAERLDECGIPFIAFDPIGVWRYLRVPGKGKNGRGLPVVVAGGEAGDLPLTPESAPAIVEAAMQQGVSLIIDLFHMELSKADWRRIVSACIQLLLHRNKQYGLRHVFLEEAAEFAPQLVRGDHGRVYAEVEKLARMGGNSGLGLTLINQRAEQINKAVLELCDNLFLHGQKGRNSIAALGKWLDAGGLTKARAKEITNSMGTMQPGQAWAWMAKESEPVLINIPTKCSFHPDRKALRDMAGAPTAKAVDVKDFVGALQEALPKIEVEKKANDPKALQLEIRDLKRQLIAQESINSSSTPTSGADIASAETRGYERAVKEYGARELETLRRVHASGCALFRCPVTELAEAIENHQHGINQEIERLQKVPPPRQHPTPQQNHTPQNTRPIAKSATQSENNAEITGPQRQLLAALSWWAAKGHHQPSRAQVAAIAGWKITSGHLKNVSGGLRSAGHITYPEAGTLALTDTGSALAPPATGGTAADAVKRVLTGSQKLVFDHLLYAEGCRDSRSNICNALGWAPASGHMKNVTGSLRTLKIVHYPKPGMIELESWVMQ